MNDPYGIVIGPVFTERTTTLQDDFNKYTFKVSPKATKIEIKNAVEKIFKVRVQQVNTIKVPGKLRRVRHQPGYTSSWKKAVVTLREEDRIDYA